MRTIAIVNQKGGCGKTTTAINLSAIYAKRGFRTLLVDMDPQSHCAAGLGVPERRIEYSIGDALIGDLDPHDLRWEVTRNLDLAPSTMRLAAMEAPGGGLHSLPDKDRRLEKLLKNLKERYDICLIDCPPTIGLLTFNALRAARETLIPVETGYFSLIGAEKQWKTIQRMIEHIGRPIACHMLATMFEPQSEVARNILKTLKRRYAGQLLPTIIRLHEEIREATCLGQPVVDYAPNSEAKKDFIDLADWLGTHVSPEALTLEAARELDSMTPLGVVNVNRCPHDVRIPTSTPTAGPGDRAFEMVQRVQSIARREEEQEKEAHTPVRTAAEAAIPAKPNMTTVTIEKPRTAPKEVEVKPEPKVVDITAVKPAPAARSLTTTRTGIMTTDRLLPQAASFPKPLDCEIALPEPAKKKQAISISPHLYGIRCTPRGILFAQPAETGRCVFVAGDFNGWSSTATPMKHCEDSGILQVIVDMPPGRYLYQLIVDGRWQSDRYNMQEQRNEFGEPNSLLVVPEG